MLPDMIKAERSRFLKEQKLVRRHLQNSGDVKKSVQRDSFNDVGRLDMADVSRGAVDPLGQFFLGQAPKAAVVGDLQADLAILLCIGRFHT